MTDKKKQIEEMAVIIERAFAAHKYGMSDNNARVIERLLRGRSLDFVSKALYDAGYRKQSDVAEDIIEMLKAAKPVVKVHFEAYNELIENIAAEYGVEVEK